MTIDMPVRRLFILYSVLVAATCCLTPAAGSTTYYVSAISGNNNQPGTSWATAKRTIQAAVDLTVAGDTVVVSNGVYASGMSAFPSISGGGNSSNRVTITKNILVQSVNGPEVTIIRGAAGTTRDTAVRCVYISAGVLSGFTLENGHTPNDVLTALDMRGGGAYANGGTLTNCIVTGSVSHQLGGGVYLGTVYNSILSNNTATTGSGGGAANSLLFDCEVVGNQASAGGGGLFGGQAHNSTFLNNTAQIQGGGVRLSTVYNSLFEGNTALGGGGAHESQIYDSTFYANVATNGAGVSDSTVYNSTLSGGYAGDRGGGAYYSTLYDSTLSGNISRLSGGGALNSTLTRCELIGNSTLGGGQGGGAMSSTLIDCLIMSNSVPGGVAGGGTYNSTVTRSVYIGNTAGNGGGSSEDTLRNCILTGNSASNHGGGAFKSQVINSLVTHNTAASSGGGVSGGNVRHSTVVNNSAGISGGGVSRFDATVNVTSSIVYSNQAPSSANYLTNVTFSYSLTSPLPAGTGNVSGDPLFVDPIADNYRLTVGSPAIDAALNSHALTATDLDDGIRIVNGTMDMGAYEFRASGLSPNATWHVSTNGYDGAVGTSWATAKRTIQAAADKAIDGDTILVNDGVYGTGGAVTPGGVVSNRVVITADIVIRSLNGPERTRITGVDAGNTLNSVRSVFMTNGTMSGFTISGGRAPVVSPHFSNFNTWGGGVYGLGGTFEYCIIEGNTAHNGGGAYGGTFRNSLFRNNVAAGSGGGSSYANLVNCTVSGNHANDAGGGTHYGTTLNSIVYFNTGGNYAFGTFNYSATTPAPAGGTGNITAAPVFVSSGDYRLAAGSPGIDVGSSADAVGTTDLAAGPRIVNGTVDMGAYEFRGVGMDPITWYVATNGNDFAVGTNWSSAKQTIQAAVDQAIDGDTVMVSNGVYAVGTTVTPGFATLNRVVITKDITVRSANGAAVTTITGVNNGNNLTSVRPVYITAGTLTGFTLTGGYAPNVSSDSENRNGGGAYAVGGTLNQCIVTGNGGYDGGGVYGGTVNNSIVANNQAVNGGGTHSALLNNVTVSGNTATTGGGGTEHGTANNAIVYFNTSTTPANNNYLGGSFAYSAATPLPPGTGNIDGNPLFVGSNFFLSASSPCVDAGNNGFVVGTGDVEGSARIVDGTVDMGARELYPLVSVEATGAVTTGTGRYTPGSEITISAERENGHWSFVEWDDGFPQAVDGPTLKERVITVPDASTTYTAIYTQFLGALTFYVSTSGNDQLDGLSWATALQTPQKGVDIALDGDTVLVGDGVYATGGRVVHLYGITNRVVINKAITMRSLNGPLVTTIAGNGMPGPGAVRGVYVGTNAVLSGFTLRDGATDVTGDADSIRENGGGAWCEPTGVISNSIIRDNRAAYAGGGVSGGTLFNCLIVGNIANSDLLILSEGGGAFNATLYNCTVVGNRAGGDNFGYGGGTAYSTHENSIIYFNTANNSPNGYDGIFDYSCTAPLPGSGTGNIAVDPLFVSLATTNLALSAGSPAIDAGNNAVVSGTIDVNGQPRIVNNIVDVGAYEYQFNGGYWLWAADIINGQTNLTDSATDDGYPNLLKYVTGSSATVPDDLASLTIALTNGAPVTLFNRNPNAIDVTLIVESTTNLLDASWSGLATNVAGSWGASPWVTETGAGSPRTVTLEPPDANNRMYRLRVTRP